MKGATLLLLAILAMTSVFAGNNLQLIHHNVVARAHGTDGRVQVHCNGGSGQYSYQFNGLPQGWSAAGNTISIPNINNISGQQFNINVRVVDAATGQVLNSNIILSVNGVRVGIQQGGAIGGTFGVSQGSSSSAGSAGSSGSSVSVTSSTITSLYDSYEGLPAGASISRQGFTYTAPTGAPRIPNPAPRIISTSQAQYDFSRDANAITVEDVKRTAIFNRQISANKAVANLVSIVRKLTANVNAATNDLTILTQMLADADAANAECEGVIFDLSNTKAKIENAIADRQTTIADVNGQIAAAIPVLQQLQAALDDLQDQRNQIEADRSPNAARLADLENQLANCKAQKAALQKQLKDLRMDINGVEADIQNAKDSAAAAPGEIDQINKQIPIVDDRIADLKNQLAAAERERAQLDEDKAAAEALIAAAAAEVARLEAILDDLNNQADDLEDQIAAKQANCDRIEAELDAFRNELADIEANYKTLLDEIAAQQTLVNNQQAQIDALEASIANLPSELQLLRAELSRVQAALNRQFFICEATADDVRRAQQNVEAMRNRLNQDTEALRTANNNLQAARAEKELADVAVEEIIAVYTDALPFSVVPNVETNVQQRNVVTIGDLSNYLSSAYRAGVDPARPSTVTNLYPLSVTTISTISGPSAQYLYDFDCDTISPVTGQGRVHSVEPGKIKVDTDSGMVDLQIAGCTNIDSTKQGQVLGTNDQIYFRGSSAGGAINAHSVTCV